MGVRGAKPSPTSRRTLAKLDVTGTGVLVEPTSELDDHAALAWNAVVEDLNAQKLFRGSDALLLTTFCELYSLSQKSLARIKEFDLRLEDISAELDSMSPREYETNEEYDDAVRKLERREESISNRRKRDNTAYMNYVRQMVSLAAEFALSPVSRMRLGLMQAAGAAALSDLLGGEIEGDDDLGQTIPGEVVSDG